MSGADNQQPSLEKLCWLAGFINADGHFGAHYKQRDKQGCKTGVKLVFSITNYDKAIIREAREIMSKIIGRRARVQRVYHAKARNVWVYRATSKKQSEIKELCTAVFPYLVGERKERAKILLAYLDQHKYYAKNTKADYKILDKLKRMTTKGILAKKDFRKFFKEGSETKEEAPIRG